ncbi:hypothetical protein EP7_000177 [Isosphaeraceae bacterium EP7]
MAIDRFALRLSFILLAAIAGLLIGFSITHTTFENQFQQGETSKSFLISVLALGGLYLVLKQRASKGGSNLEL